MALSFPTAPFAIGRPTLSAARARLADVLNHPAFEAERRHKAGELMHTSRDAQQVCRWAALALRESEQWEDAAHRPARRPSPARPRTLPVPTNTLPSTMHPDLINLHAAVSALLRANLAVARAARAYKRAYNRASRRPYPLDFWFRDSILGYTDPEDDTLRAEARQREAADRESASWEPLSTVYPSPELTPFFSSPNPSLNGTHA